MTTLLLTHPCFVEHDTGPGHPERPDRMRAIDKVLGHELFNGLKREEAPLRDDVEDADRAGASARATSSGSRACAPRRARSPCGSIPTPCCRPSPGSRRCARSAPASPPSTRVMDPGSQASNNAFAQVRPCGHHAETERAMGFCIFNNVAIAGALCPQEVRLRARRRRRFRRAPRQRHAGHLLVRQEPVFRLHAPDAALSRHRRAERDRRRQHLERAAAARRRRRPVQGGLRVAHPAVACAISAPTSC